MQNSCEISGFHYCPNCDCSIPVLEAKVAELERENHDRMKAADAKIAEQAPTIERLTQERDDARAANECDRTTLHRMVHEIDSEIKGRMWLIEGRGSYEWDDDRYRQEFGWAVQALEAKMESLRRIAGNLKNCPNTQAGVDAALSKQEPAAAKEGE